MKNTKLLESLNRIGLFLGGTVGSHLIDKALSYPGNSIAERNQAIRDANLKDAAEEANNFFEFATEQFQVIHNSVEASSNIGASGDDNVDILDSAVLRSDWYQIADTIKSCSNSLLSKLSELNIPDWENSPIKTNLQDVIKEVNRFNSILENDTNINNYVPGLSKLYEYLDTLTLLQESALLHIILFFILLTTVINILGVLFGNELLKYFNLEERYPNLAIFFKLRSKFQRYYLIWNVFILFTVCICGIGINVLLISI